MRKNKTQEINVVWEIKNLGNWNYKDKSIPPLNTKPIAVVTLDDDEFVFQHWDIMELIRAYHEADKRSISMIRAGFSGSVLSAEKPLLDKLLELIKDLRNKDCGIQKCNIPTVDKMGQSSLRV